MDDYCCVLLVCLGVILGFLLGFGFVVADIYEAASDGVIEFLPSGGRFVRVPAEQEDVESSWERSRASFDCMEDCLFCSNEEIDSAYDGCKEFCSVWVYKLENSYTWRRC